MVFGASSFVSVMGAPFVSLVVSLRAADRLEVLEGSRVVA